MGENIKEYRKRLMRAAAPPQPQVVGHRRQALLVARERATEGAKMEYAVWTASEAADKGMQLAGGKPASWFCLASRHGASWKTVGWFSRKETAEKVKAHRVRVLEDCKATFARTMRRED